MKQPEHTKNAGEINALVNFITTALVLFFNNNHTAFYKETK